MLTEVWYNESGTRTLAYEYEYTDDGQVHTYSDNINDYTYVYKYDRSNRLVGSLRYNNNEYTYDFNKSLLYDKHNQVSSINYYLKYNSTDGIFNYNWYYIPTYIQGGVLQSMRLTAGNVVGDEDFEYDLIGRVESKNYEFTGSSGSFKNQVWYTYASDELDTTTSGLISQYKSTVNETAESVYWYTYTYENYISSITLPTGKLIRYYYDRLGQLIREDNEERNATYLYKYDNAGNITAIKMCNLTSSDYTPTPISTETYTYSSSSWGDLLTGYNGATITYDNIGNPLSYYNGANYTFTWSGRQLETATKGGVTYSFAYDENGYRTSKTKNGVTTTYYYDDGKLVAEKTNGNVTVYLYDSAGAPLGMQYRIANSAKSVWQTYWYERDLLNNIVAVYDHNGTKLVSYTYDAWGNFTTAYHNGGASTKAADNPFTYRGYYYDNETGFYLTGTRYYDPEIGRFINADGQLNPQEGMTGYNLFQYCGNNPVNRIDPTGEAWWHWALGAAVVAACAVATVVTCGGFAAAAGAVAAVGSGVAAATTASTIAAGAFIGSATVYGMAVVTAASTSSSVKEFNDKGNWGTVAATAGGAVVGGAGAYVSTRTPTTKVYRSVSNAEAQDIKNTGQFNLSPGGMESKQFGFNLAETRQFGNMMGQNTIVSAKVPTSMLNQFYTGGVDTSIFRSGTLTVYGDQLGMFNQAVSGTIKIMP